MVEPATGVVDANGLHVHYLRWGDPTDGKPAAVLVHGTGFCAATWRAVAERLADTYVVYAYDRRGHGRTNTPDGGYEFRDFADDLLAFLNVLNLRDVYGIGHSAGGADVLLAATADPGRFARVFVHEAPAGDPAEQTDPGTGLTEEMRLRLRERANRRAEFLSRDDVFARYVSREPFNRWQPEILREYIEHGFEEGPDGIVRLRCHPDVEARMLVPLMLLALRRYRGDERGDPWAALPQLACPVTVSVGGESPARYHAGAEVVLRRVPHARRVELDAVHHCAPQEAPEALAAAIRAFADPH